MGHIVHIPIAAPAVLLSSFQRKLNSISFRVFPVFAHCPGDVPLTVVIALQSQLYGIHIHWTFALSNLQAVRKILNAHIDGILWICNRAWCMGIPGIKTALRALHGIGATTTGFLHHHRFNQKHIVRDSMFLGILLYDRFIGFDLLADWQDFHIILIAGEHHTGEAHNNQNNHQNQHSSTASGNDRNQFLHGLCDCFGGSGSIFGGFLCSRSNRSCRYPAAMCRLSGNSGGFLGCLGCSLRRLNGGVAHVLHGFHRGACRFDGTLGCLDCEILCGVQSLLDCAIGVFHQLNILHRRCRAAGRWCPTTKRMGRVRNCEPLGCPFCPQFRFGRSNLLLVNRFLLWDRSAGARFGMPAHTRGNSPIGRYPVGLGCMVDVLCSGAILHRLRRNGCRCVRGRLWTA